ncbi:MAG: SRPBCC family protein [Xenococcaceae cyanobacterium MO_167.B27]|nr:SRPBCC family protein [Xenococcaceae cyanobacterium MO_167.B27]
MSVNEYNFVTVLKIEAPLQAVWDVICNVEDLPDWWKAVVSTKVLDLGDMNGINHLSEQTWKGVLPYKLSMTSKITEVDNLKSIKLVATGDVEGRGKWTFTEEEGIVTVQYNWDAKTKQKGINFLAFFLKPLLAWNHDEMMRWGAKGLANKLNARLIQY